MLALRELQHRFLLSIASEPGPGAPRAFDDELLGELEGRGRLDPAQRLDVYAQMYWARLHDVLADDFPKVAHVLGPERFRTLACAYLRRQPSEHPSVRHVGRAFADFLGTRKEAEDFPFLADLARLEWARVEVFDAPDAVPLGLEDIERIEPGVWPHVRLAPVPALRLLRTEWPVHETWAALHEGRGDAAPKPAATHLRVWRQGSFIYQASMGACEHAAFGCVARGKTFASLCEALEEFAGPEGASAAAARVVLRWIDDGLVVRSG